MMIGRTYNYGDHEGHSISELDSTRGSDSIVPLAKLIVNEADSHNVIIEDEPDARYTIEDVRFGDLQTKVLKNTERGEYVQIVTDLGGRIEDLVL